MNTIKETAEKILGRALQASEGVGIDAIVVAEKKLEVTFPQALKDFYLSVGKMPLFTDSFEFFAKPKQIYIKAGKLVFLEENQAILSWGVDLNDLSKDKVRVYNTSNIGDADADVKWNAEALPLTDFLQLIMYYQVTSAETEVHEGTEGGYPLNHVGYRSDIEKANLLADFDTALFENWEKVVDSNGLVIYWCQYGLMLYYTVTDSESDLEDQIYLLTRKDSDLSVFKQKYGFNQLED